MSASLQVLVLAAGLGTRLRPLTERMPKPLVPLVDASVLAHQVRLARTLGDVPIHVNAHYLAEQIEAAAPSLGLAKVWVEHPEILGTGGPLSRMWASGERGELLVLNGDCYSHFDLGAFVAKARASGADCALLARSFPQVDTLRIDGQGYLCGIAGRFGAAEANHSATFTGTAWYGPSAWGDIQAGEKDIRDFWRRRLEMRNAPAVIVAGSDTAWIDMGEPAGLLDAALCRLNELGLRNWCEDGSAIDPESDWKQVVVHVGAHVGAGAHLRQVLLLPGAQVLPGEVVERQIRAEGITWQL